MKARAVNQSLKDNDGLGAAAVAGAAAAASIRAQSLKSKELPPVVGPPRKQHGEGEKSVAVEQDSPALCYEKGSVIIIQSQAVTKKQKRQDNQWWPQARTTRKSQQLPSA